MQFKMLMWIFVFFFSMHVVKHVVIITNTAPFMTPVIKTCPYNGFSFDELLDVFNKVSNDLLNPSNDLLIQLHSL